MMTENYTVYKHTLPNGKVYVGLTSKKDVRYRWDNGNGYKTQMFYRAIQKYGWDNITHEVVIDGLTFKDAEYIEILLISQYDSTNPERGYNIAKGGEVNSGYHLREETRQKMSEVHKGRISPMLGKHHSKESCKRMSESHKGLQAGKKHPMYGKHHTDESRKKNSDKHIGKPSPRRKSVLCVETGITYDSITDAEKHTGVSRSKISVVCNGKRKTAGTYHWRYI